MSYLSENFLLNGKTAEQLYKKYAENAPIFDYHCHLSERCILENAEIADIYEVWLGGDHYKWRLMRNYGIDEDYITGSRSNKEKFAAYCTCLGTAFGNPLYHWSQVELKEFFGCELEINQRNADAIFDECNSYIRSHRLTPQKLIEQSGVRAIFTTNEVFDDLSVFCDIAKKGYKFKVLPAYRADKVMNIDAPAYLSHLSRLEALTNKISDLDGLESALTDRLDAFIAVGCRAADISLEYVPGQTDRACAERALAKRLSGVGLSVAEADGFKSYLTYFLMKLYAVRGIVCELHLGAMRNNNTVMLERLGPDTGYDSISDVNSTKALSRLLDRLSRENALPRLILFNLNPKMNSELMALAGCFQDGTAKGKVQYGPAWWFLDNKVGMEKHLQDLTATGHLSAFVGMLTDSRSLLSYPRHHYFRRILCNYLGQMIDEGLMTRDTELVGEVIEDICYNNAVKYFKL